MSIPIYIYPSQEAPARPMLHVTLKIRWHCIVLCWVVLYCIVLYCIVLYCVCVYIYIYTHVYSV